MTRRWGGRQRGRWVTWAVVGSALLTTSCAGAIGAGAAAAVIVAGVATFTCYDRVSVVVTDRATGTPLCDAKVSFFAGKSETRATSCYQAALTAGQYRMHVERRGLAPFDEPVEVKKEDDCGSTTQTMYVALERAGAKPAPGPAVVAVPGTPADAAPLVASPTTITAAPPAAAAPSAAASSAAAPSAAAPSAAAPSAGASTSPAPPPAATAPSPAAPAPSPTSARAFPPTARPAPTSGTFPDAAH